MVMKFILLLFLAGCAFDFEPTYSVDTLLVPYVNDFYKEAALRNIPLVRQNLIVKFQQNLSDQGEWGLSINDDQHTVLIDRDYFLFYTKETNHPNRVEPLIFHELGHALLRRSHNNYQSLMNPGWLAGGTAYEGNNSL